MIGFKRDHMTFATGLKYFFQSVDISELFHSEFNGLWIACGFERNGISLYPNKLTTLFVLTRHGPDSLT